MRILLIFCDLVQKVASGIKSKNFGKNIIRILGEIINDMVAGQLVAVSESEDETDDTVAKRTVNENRQNGKQATYKERIRKIILGR